MPSGRVTMAAGPVLAAGIGVRRGRDWAVRLASFRVGPAADSGSVVGISVTQPEYATAIIDVLAGIARPAYGELRVLGHDMSAARGRAVVRRRVGVARRSGRSVPAVRIRGLVEHAARLARPDRRDRHALAAAILDVLSLTPWADVSLNSAPDTVARRARLAAAAVHQPELLLLDGLLDDLAPRDATALADAVRRLSRDCGILIAGCDDAALALACDELLVAADGVLIG